jgi:hypothetical protein
MSTFLAGAGPISPWCRGSSTRKNHICHWVSLGRLRSCPSLPFMPAPAASTLEPLPVLIMVVAVVVRIAFLRAPGDSEREGCRRQAG